MKKHSILSALIYLTTFLFSMAAYAQDQDESITEKEQKEVIEAVGKQLTDKYVFPEMGKKMADQLKKNMKKGQKITKNGTSKRCQKSTWKKCLKISFFFNKKIVFFYKKNRREAPRFF